MVSQEANRFTRDWIGHLRNLLIAKYVAKPARLLNLSSENVARLKKQSDEYSAEQITKAIRVFSKALSDGRYAPSQRIVTELAIIELCEMQ